VTIPVCGPAFHDAPRPGYEARYLLQVAMMVEPLSTDHLLSPALTTVKQLSLPPFQEVQKPSFDSFQVPSPRLPVPIGWRFILPSAMKVILNLRFDGVVAVKGLPSKKVFWISAGASFAAAGFAGAAAGAGAAVADTVSTALKTIPAEIAPVKDFAAKTFATKTRAAMARMASLLSL
jgi:hypothetical protein